MSSLSFHFRHIKLVNTLELEDSHDRLNHLSLTTATLTPSEGPIKGPGRLWWVQRVEGWNPGSAEAALVTVLTHNPENAPLHLWDLFRPHPGHQPSLPPTCHHLTDCWQAAGTPFRLLDGSEVNTATSRLLQHCDETEGPTRKPLWGFSQLNLGNILIANVLIPSVAYSRGLEGLTFL